VAADRQQLNLQVLVVPEKRQLSRAQLFITQVVVVVATKGIKTPIK
jgi:hypothetical protein